MNKKNCTLQGILNHKFTLKDVVKTANTAAGALTTAMLKTDESDFEKCDASMLMAAFMVTTVILEDEET